MVRCNIVRVQSNRFAVLGLCPRPVPIRFLENCQGRMRFSQCRIEFDCPLCCTPDLCRSLILGEHSTINEEYVRLCQTGKCLCVVWIVGNGLVKLSVVRTFEISLAHRPSYAF